MILYGSFKLWFLLDLYLLLSLSWKLKFFIFVRNNVKWLNAWITSKLYVLLQLFFYYILCSFFWVCFTLGLVCFIIQFFLAFALTFFMLWLLLCCSFVNYLALECFCCMSHNSWSFLVLFGWFRSFVDHCLVLIYMLWALRFISWLRG